MTNRELLRLFPNASADVIAANAAAQDSGAHPELECSPVHEPLAAGQGQEAAPERVHIRIVSVRKRLCDPDNLSEKWLLDCLRYCGAIRGDEPDKITLETTQRKAAKGEAEYTTIEIYEEVRTTMPT